MTMSDLKPGETGRVIEIGTAGALKRRLIDMGITPGILVTVRRTAPLGDPMEVTLRGYELSIRREEAKRILVEREAKRNGGK